MSYFVPDTSRMILLTAAEIVRQGKPLLDCQVRDLRRLYPEAFWPEELVRYLQIHPEGEPPSKVPRGRPKKHIGIPEHVRRARVLADYWVFMIFDEVGERAAHANGLPVRRDRVIARLQDCHLNLPAEVTVRNNLTLWSKNDLTRGRAITLFRDWLSDGRPKLSHWR